MTKKKIKTLDVARAARKLQEEKDGERKISDFSTPALRYFALEFESDYKDSRREAGSASKKMQGFWYAAKHLVETDPEIKPKKAWNDLPDLNVADWSFELDGNQMIQRYHGRDKGTKKSQDWRTVRFDAFRQTYIYGAKKETLEPDE